jgi:CO/xanthine dehydrogenase FAD-binding subunit
MLMQPVQSVAQLCELSARRRTFLSGTTELLDRDKLQVDAPTALGDVFGNPTVFQRHDSVLCVG